MDCFLKDERRENGFYKEISLKVGESIEEESSKTGEIKNPVYGPPQPEEQKRAVSKWAREFYSS
jgi:hypothetical protein